MEYTAKDFASNQEVKWCPGCGDYSILKQMQSVLPSLNIPKEKIVFVSGIGCSSRFPYYMDTYGLHSIHGRAPSVASGIKLANPDLNVWIITGDGDGLSIGGNHLIHLFRRNVDVNVLLFNNEIYGLTKGQFSPTSNKGLKTKSSPYGNIDRPFNPMALALGTGASFVSRTLDRDVKHLREILLLAQQHRGTSFVEFYQNCIIFNDGVFDEFTNKDTKMDKALILREGEPLIFGKEQELAIKLYGLTPKVVKIAETDEDLWIHDSKDKAKAMLLTQFSFEEAYLDFPRPFGVIYQENRDTYEDLFQNQMAHIRRDCDMNAVLRGDNFWEVK